MSRTVELVRAALEGSSARRPTFPFTSRDHAVALADQYGLKIFTLVPGGKAPREKEFYNVASADPQAVHAMFSDPATGEALPFNIGVLTGDDIVAIDVDCKNGKPGFASLAQLGLPDDTLIVRTPTGGLHYLFKTPREVSNVSDSDKAPSPLGHGIDVRGRHGYVVGAGSVIAGKAYEIENEAPLGEIPVRVLERLAAPRERNVDTTAPATEPDTDAAIARAAKYLRDEAPLAIEGAGGDDTTFRVAAIVKDMGLSEVAAFDVMAEHWNERCSPPWELDELQRKVENAFSYGLSAAGSQSPAVDFGGVADIPAPIYREGTLAARRGTRRQFKRLGDPSLIVGPEWLLKPWLPRSGVVLLAGQSQIGKSFLAIDLAAALANGSSWFGHTPRDMVGSLYVAAEGEQTIGGRLEAVRLTRLNGMAQASVPIFPDNLDDVERPDDPRVRVNELLEHFAHAIVSARDTMAEEGLPPLGVVFIDTLGDAFQVDDNDTSTVKALMSGLGKLARRLAILIVGITHFGKDDRAGVAGTYNWKAGADVVLAATGEVNEVAGTVKRRQLVLNKSRYVETGFISAFDLTVVDIGLDPDGTPAKAAAITATTAKPKAEKPSPHSDLLKECLDLALVDHAIEIDGYQVAPRYEVMKWFRERKPGSKDSGNVSRAFAWAERWADVKLFTRDGIEYLGEGRWPVLPE